MLGGLKGQVFRASGKAFLHLWVTQKMEPALGIWRRQRPSFLWMDTDLRQGSWLGTLITAWTPTLTWPHGWVQLTQPCRIGLCVWRFCGTGYGCPRASDRLEQRKVCLFSTLGRVRHGGGLVAKSSLALAIPWTAAHQTSKSLGFPRQDYWSGLPFPSPGDLPDPGIQPASPASCALADRFFTTEPSGSPLSIIEHN